MEQTCGIWGQVVVNFSWHDFSVDSAKLLKAEATRLRNTSWPLRYSLSFCQTKYI